MGEMKEATARIKINRLLEGAGWRFFPDGKLAANIQLEPSVTIKIADLDALGDDFDKTEKGLYRFPAARFQRVPVNCPRG
jgi:type I restriction enzyme R subunit